MNGFRPSALAAATLLIILSSTHIVAQTSDNQTEPRAYFETGTNFVLGSAQEIVYKSGDSEDTDKLSLLVYPIPPSMGVHAGIGIRWLSFLDTYLRIDTVWPLNTGNLTDYDWITVPDTEDPQKHSDTRGFMTSYIDLDFRVSFPLSAGIFRFEPVIGFAYSHRSWEGWNTVHVEYGGSPIYLYGHTLDYRQTWLSPYAGFMTGFELTPISVLLGLHVSPYSYAEDRDIHILTGKTFLDYMPGGWVLSPRFDFRIALSDRTVLTLAADYRIAAGARGDIVQSTNGSGTEENTYVRSVNQAGAALELFTVSVGVRVGM